MTGPREGPARPSASVVVPFAGTDAQLGRLLDELDDLALGPADELIVADNRPHAAGSQRGRVRIEAAPGPGTPGFARNTGAKRARGEWLVFIDADTRPSRSLLADYFELVPAPETAVLAGSIVDVAERRSLAARYGVARGHMSQQATLARRQWRYAQTANCAVRRRDFEAIGGFEQAARAGEDADLCYRLQAVGCRIEQRRRATVEHRGRETLAALLRQLALHGSGSAWLNRRYPGSFPPPSPRQLAGRLIASARQGASALTHGEREAAEFALLDMLGGCAFELGRLLPNEAHGKRLSLARKE